MGFSDLRSYLAALEARGELARIAAEVDWNLEMAAICAKRNLRGGPALLFENVKDYPDKYVAAEIYAGSFERPWERIALSLGLSPEVSYEELVETISDRYEKPLKPCIVESGPCKENIQIGPEVDILSFPFPYIHDGDGGRYSTCHCQINRDPDSGWTNWGLYRFMIHTKNRLGGLVQPGQHFADIFYQKYEARGKSMPFAIALGGSPAIFLAASVNIPPGLDEADYAGGFNGEPVEVVKCETNDLYVPAYAEVVIEGEMPPGERWDEGPFGEYFGFMHGPRAPQPVYKIKAITYRNNPILPMTAEGCGLNSSLAVSSTTLGWSLTHLLKRVNRFPVRAAYFPPQAPWSCVVVSTQVPYSGFPKKIGNLLFANSLSLWFNTVIVVDHDVDPTDVNAVFHDLVIKAHKEFGFIKYEQEPASPLSAYMRREEKQSGKTTKMLIDATTPREWRPEEQPMRLGFQQYPQEIQEKVLARWQEYGFSNNVDTGKR